MTGRAKSTIVSDHILVHLGILVRFCDMRYVK